VWWTDLRGKGTRNSPNGSLYGSGSPGRRELIVEARIGGRGGRRLGRELRGGVPELGDGSAGLGTGWRELAPARCLMVGQAAADSWVAWR
jgi:hypothetical protein